jgi:hypothetical protein
MCLVPPSPLPPLITPPLLQDLARSYHVGFLLAGEDLGPKCEQRESVNLKDSPDDTLLLSIERRSNFDGLQLVLLLNAQLVLLLNAQLVLLLNAQLVLLLNAQLVLLLNAQLVLLLNAQSFL